MKRKQNHDSRNFVNWNDHTVLTMRIRRWKSVTLLYWIVSMQITLINWNNIYWFQWERKSCYLPLGAISLKFLELLSQYNVYLFRSYYTSLFKALVKRHPGVSNLLLCIANYLIQLKIVRWNWGHPWLSGSALDWGLTGRAIGPAPGAWFITQFISLAQVVPRQV